MMDQQIGEEIRLNVAQDSYRGRRRGKRRGMTQHATNRIELSLANPGLSGLRVLRGRLEESHEVREIVRVRIKVVRGELLAEVGFVLRQRVAIAAGSLVDLVHGQLVGDSLFDIVGIARELEEAAVMPPDGTQVGVFGYPGAAKVPLGTNYMATPEHFFAPLGATSAACRHEPRQDFTVPYDLPHRANGYSGCGVWYFSADPIWSPQPHLCGIVATECTIDKVVSGFKIETILKFLQANEALLLP
jgi:hypothetical protein